MINVHIFLGLNMKNLLKLWLKWEMSFLQKQHQLEKTAYIENMPKKLTINPQLVLLKKFRGVSKYLHKYRKQLISKMK